MSTFRSVSSLFLGAHLPFEHHSRRRCCVGWCAVTPPQKTNHCLLGISALPSRDDDRPRPRERKKASQGRQERTRTDAVILILPSDRASEAALTLDTRPSVPPSLFALYEEHSSKDVACIISQLLVGKPKQFRFGFGRKFRPVSVSVSVFRFSPFSVFWPKHYFWPKQPVSAKIPCFG